MIFITLVDEVEVDDGDAVVDTSCDRLLWVLIGAPEMIKIMELRSR